MELDKPFFMQDHVYVDAEIKMEKLIKMKAKILMWKKMKMKSGHKDGRTVKS